MPISDTPEELKVRSVIGRMGVAKQALYNAKRDVWEYMQLAGANEMLALVLQAELEEFEVAITRVETEAKRALTLGEVHG